VEAGAPGKIRTRGLMVRSHPLYPLSYGRAPDEHGSLAATDERHGWGERMSTTPAARGFWLTMLVVFTFIAAPNVVAADGPPSDLLPDLRMKPPSAMRITHQRTSAGAKRRLLRFTARMVNGGDGPFHVHGKRDCATSACPEMDLTQRIRQSDGTTRSVETDEKAKFNVRDGHNHWHVMAVERYVLIPMDATPETMVETTRGAKVGFCFFDTDANNLSLPGAPNRPVYGKAGCATGRPDALKINEGLSVGWLDLYPWDIASQWIDTTDLPDGRYLLCESADPRHAWLESKENNNQAWSQIQLWHDNDGDHIKELASDRSSCSDQIPQAPAALWSLDPAESEPVPFGQAAALLCPIDRKSA
jgi:hypothetical protein